ncbi:MAG: ABC transporter ATP-binding protein [Lachnospiraceae bacterium]|nr:ABC transporter ATP-binding protein [Lachnospiraceae bacterium]
MLDARNLTVKYGDFTALSDVSFHVNEGEWLMLVGPNGAGKSTAVNALSGGVSYEGTIEYNRRDMRTYRPRDLARYVGVLSQAHSVGYPFTVREVVGLGRYSHSPSFFSKSADDESAVAEALEITGLTKLADHSVLTLSGGELQRTFLAQLFAQNPHILLLDEPSNHLDLIYQKQIFELVKTWLLEKDRCVISVVHDLSLALAYGNCGLLLGDGQAKAFGAISEVFSPDVLNTVYGMDVRDWMGKLYSNWENTGK